jgi:hypothetical protein
VLRRATYPRKLSYAGGYRLEHNVMVAHALDTPTERHDAEENWVVHEMVSPLYGDAGWASQLASTVPDNCDFLAAPALFLNNPPPYDPYIDE